MQSINIYALKCVLYTEIKLLKTFHEFNKPFYLFPCFSSKLYNILFIKTLQHSFHQNFTTCFSSKFYNMLFIKILQHAFLQNFTCFSSKRCMFFYQNFTCFSSILYYMLFFKILHAFHQNFACFSLKLYMPFI